jgi:transcriptional regulator PpsR
MALTNRYLSMPGKYLADLDADTASKLIAATADIVLVLDREGSIRDLALATNDLLECGCQRWLNLPWAQTVTIESQPKIRALLEPQGSGEGLQWRQVNHPTEMGADLPVSYSVVRLGGGPYSLALGRDLRPQMALQQRLVAAQQSMERDYWRLRQVETRYRLLFQMAAEPVLILKDSIEHIEEANPAAQQIFGEVARRPGWSLAASLHEDSVAPLQQMLERLRSAGRAEPLEVRLASGGQTLMVAATPFRQDHALHFLLRFSSTQAGLAVSGQAPEAGLWQQVMEHAPDAMVLTDPSGRVLQANQAFLDLAQLGSPAQAQGQMLDRWLGRTEVDFRVLASNLRQHGSVRLFATRLQGEHGSAAEVEVSAAAIESQGQRRLGFAIRDMGRRLDAEGRGAKELPRSAGQMTELVGRMPLKDIVRETTDLIEQLCIEAALQLTGDNRASAAEMLGLSRQSLYIKLRRFGIGDLGSDADAANPTIER